MRTLTTLEIDSLRKEYIEPYIEKATVEDIMRKYNITEAELEEYKMHLREHGEDIKPAIVRT